MAKPVYKKLNQFVVVNLEGKMFVLVGGTTRRQPYELRLWGFNVQGDIVALSKTWLGWAEASPTEQLRPCYRGIVPQVRQLTFQAGLALGQVGPLPFGMAHTGIESVTLNEITGFSRL